IYNNGGGISFGSTNVFSGWFVNALPQYQNNTLLMRAGNQIELYDAGNVLRGRIYGNSSTGMNIEAAGSNNLRLTAETVIMKYGTSVPSNTVVGLSSNYTLPGSATNGTIKIIGNTGGSTIRISGIWGGPGYVDVPDGDAIMVARI